MWWRSRRIIVTVILIISNNNSINIIIGTTLHPIFTFITLTTRLSPQIHPMNYKNSNMSYPQTNCPTIQQTLNLPTNIHETKRLILICGRGDTRIIQKINNNKININNNKININNNKININNNNYRTSFYYRNRVK